MRQSSRHSMKLLYAASGSRWFSSSLTAARYSDLQPKRLMVSVGVQKVRRGAALRMSRDPTLAMPVSAYLASRDSRTARGQVRHVIEQVVGLPGFAAPQGPAAQNDSALGKVKFLPDLSHQVPFLAVRANKRRGDELGADIRLGEGIFIHVDTRDVFFRIDSLWIKHKAITSKSLPVPVNMTILLNSFPCLSRVTSRHFYFLPVLLQEVPAYGSRRRT